MAPTSTIAVVGGGAAGLMAAIWAGRAGGRRVVLLDGARTLGAKFLISGGGRCNVTHHQVDETAFAGPPPPPSARCCAGSTSRRRWRCDVDGRIGGFNFQWAWASGYVAGTAAGAL